MPIRWREDLNRRWPVLVYADPYSHEEWVAAVTALLAHPISAPPLRLLVDRRYCAAPSTEFVTRMVGFIDVHRARFSGSRMAVVVDTTTAYGMARMFEMRLQALAVDAEVCVFRDWEVAERWLEGRPVSAHELATMARELRDHHRVAADIEVAWTLVGQKFSGTGTLVNVAPRGACLRIDQAFTPPERAEFTLHAATVPSLPPRGRLTWHRTADRPKRLMCGLVFEGGGGEAWRQWVSQVSRQS